MRRQPVSPQTTVTLSGAGAGQCSLTPPAGTRWDLQLAAAAVTAEVTRAEAAEALLAPLASLGV